MFDAVCSECGKPCKVPFQPHDDRPIYCSDCFSKQRRG
jgi:CxxC-x17-CxxC domain-containing protein